MKKYVVLDIETTGTQPLKNDIIEIGAVYIEDGQVVDTFNHLICPTEEISPYIIGITGIDNEMVKNEKSIEEIMPDFIKFCRNVPLIGHNIEVFDFRMLKVKAERLGLKFNYEVVDTLIIARTMLSALPSRKLGDLCTYYNIELTNAHRAYQDAYATYQLFLKLRQDFETVNPSLFSPQKVLWEIPKISPITLKQQKYLAKLCEMHSITMTEDIVTLTKSEASKKIDTIISQHGRL